MTLNDVISAPTFIAFMEEIWDMGALPAPGGGITLSQHPNYLQFHNAAKVAKFTGAKRTGSSRLGEKGASVLSWPDGSRAVVAYDGTACKETHHKRFHRKEAR